MRALGVDLSLASCGIALVNESGVLRYVVTVKPAKYGIVAPVEKRALVLTAVKKIYYTMNGFDVLVMEPPRLFTGGSNVPLASIEALVGLATTLEDWAHRTDVRVVKVQPASWRKAVLGDGRADKKAAAKWVLALHGRDLGEDAAEAVCQAVYGASGAWAKK